MICTVLLLSDLCCSFLGACTIAGQCNLVCWLLIFEAGMVTLPGKTDDILADTGHSIG